MSHYCDKCGGEIIFRYMDGRPVPIHLSGGCYGWSDYASNEKLLPSKSKTDQRKTTQEKINNLVSSFTIPNASCPVCGDKVYYYENEHGSRVFFDELGPPWPKHPCTDQSITSNNAVNVTDNKKDWTRFYLDNVQEIKLGKYFQTIWQGDYINQNNKVLEGFRVKTLEVESFKGRVINKFCYLRGISQTEFEISFFTNDKRDHDYILQAFTKKKFKKYYSNILNKVSESSKKNQKRRTENKEVLPSQIVGIKPIKNSYECPLCKHHFSKKEHMLEHLNQHWNEMQPSSIFKKIEKDKWIKLVLSDKEE